MVKTMGGKSGRRARAKSEPGKMMTWRAQMALHARLCFRSDLLFDAGKRRGLADLVRHHFRLEEPSRQTALSKATVRMWRGQHHCTPLGGQRP
jgi:hypothetical protein